MPRKGKKERRKRGQLSFFLGVMKPKIKWCHRLTLVLLRQELESCGLESKTGSKELLSKRLEFHLVLQHGSAYCLQRFKKVVDAYKARRAEEARLRGASISISIMFRANVMRKRDQGAVWSWGYGRNGQLGHGDRRNRLKPTLLKTFRNGHVVSLSTGESHSVAVDDSGKIWQWGDGLVTVTPRGGETELLEPRPVGIDAIGRRGSPGEKAVMVSVGECHAAIVTDEGMCYTWGLGLRGCLGHNDEFNRKAPCLVVDFERADNRVEFVSAGPMCTAVITIHGELMTWGCGLNGKLGNGGSSSSLKPRVLGDLRNDVSDKRNKLFGKLVDHVSMGKYHGVCVMDGGEVLTWGTENRGCLALETCEPVDEPEPEADAKQKKGDGQEGEGGSSGSSDDDDDFLGREVEEIIHINTPKLVPALHEQGIEITKACAAPFHMVALSAAGDLYSWGKGRHGVLGTGDEKNRVVPTKIEQEGMDAPIVDFEVGDGFTVALDQEGRLWTWGRGKCGCLGQGAAAKKHKGKAGSKKEGGAEASKKKSAEKKPAAKAKGGKKDGGHGKAKGKAKGKPQGKKGHGYNKAAEKDRHRPRSIDMEHHHGYLCAVAAGGFHALCLQQAGTMQEYIELIGDVDGCTLSAIKHIRSVKAEAKVLEKAEEALASAAVTVVRSTTKKKIIADGQHALQEELRHQLRGNRDTD
eukprot:g251.t1